MRLNPLFHIFEKYAEKIAMICEKSYTYKEIYRQILATKLHKIPHKSVVGLVGDYNLPYIVLLFALCNKKCIIAPLMEKA